MSMLMKDENQLQSHNGCVAHVTSAKIQLNRQWHQ